jgi:membrane protease YdiL (CAAX protease family)
MRNFARHHPLAVFVVLAYALSWAYWIPLAARGVRITPGGAVTHFPGLLGPAIAAYVTTALVSGRAGLRELTRRLWHTSRPAARFWLYSVSPVAFLALALLIAALLDKSPRYADFTLYSGLPPLSLLAVIGLVLIFNGYGEETGWRGFALPILQARYGFLKSALIVAAIWAGWHVPTFWTIDGYRSMTLPVLIGGFGIGLACGSLVLAQVSNVTGGSILAAAVWHLAYNMSAATAASRGLIGAVSTACVEVWAVALVVVAIRHRPVRTPISAAAA